VFWILKEKIECHVNAEVRAGKKGIDEKDGTWKKKDLKGKGRRHV